MSSEVDDVSETTKTSSKGISRTKNNVNFVDKDSIEKLRYSKPINEIPEVFRDEGLRRSKDESSRVRGVPSVENSRRNAEGSGPTMLVLKERNEGFYNDRNPERAESRWELKKETLSGSGRSYY